MNKSGDRFAMSDKIDLSKVGKIHEPNAILVFSDDTNNVCIISKNDTVMVDMLSGRITVRLVDDEIDIESVQ